MLNRMKLLLAGALLLTASVQAQKAPAKKDVLKVMRLTNQYLMNKWPDPGKSIVTNRERPSNIWTRAVYYEGLMQLHALAHNPAYLDYAVRWGEAHQWN